jgi:hypothetical protein
MAMHEACNALGNHDAARGWVEMCLDSALKTHDADFIALARYLLAKSEMTEGNWEGARRELEEGLRLYPKNAILLSSRCIMEYSTGELDAGGKTHTEIKALRREPPPVPTTFTSSQ